nr:ribosome assembly RNA-binding protein YhbY [Parachitinimonas caeni]
MQITSEQRQYLKGLAHNLKPVVMIGNNGLTDAVIREIAINLDAHELIKIRVLGDDRDLRNALISDICQQLGCAKVQHIGKLLVIYRPSTPSQITLPKPKKSKI